MALKRIPNYLRYSALACLAVFGLAAAEHHGQVKFGGLPVPGATVTATQGDKKLVALSDQQGAYSFADLAEGIWTMQVEMLCFTPIKQEVGVAANAPSPEWELKLLPFDEIKALAPPPPAPTPSTAPGATASAPATDVAGQAASSQAANGQPSAPAPSIAQAAKPVASKKAGPKNAKAGTTPAPATKGQNSFQRTGVNASPDAAKPPAETPAATPASGDLSQGATDGFLINGSQNNGASSPFAMSPAFGNNRRGFRSAYQASLGFVLDNSALNARTFSVTGQDTPKPSTNRFAGVASFGGPLNIKHIIPASRNPINFFVNYQWVRNRNGNTVTSLMPTAAERGGDFSQVLNTQGQPVQVFDPTTGLPFPGNVIPQTRISPQAKALLSLYPAPNFNSGRYNYQIPIVNALTQDDIQSRLSKTLSTKNQVNGSLAYQRGSSQNPTLFGFRDTGNSSGINTGLNWQHRFSQRLFSRFGLTFSRATSRTTPFFAYRTNISGEAGITGNNQEPQNWGPPGLSFSSGIAGLYDANLSYTRSQTGALSADTLWNRRSHNINFGGDLRRQQFNYLSQSDPRGQFTFNGASTQQTVNGQAVAGTGFDFAGFLLGIPDKSALAFGNADKYLRASSYDAYVTDDWRVRAGFTMNLGVRWEYSSPITELYGRLVNLDIAPGFGPVAPVVANSPTGSLTRLQYPDSLVHPDKHAFQPRVAIAWHPFLASSLTIRAGYGVYYDTSVYQSIATQMYQQSPLSRSLSVQNDPSNPLTLASGFNVSPNITTNTFAIDPNFRVGYSQNWQLSVQRDLPGSLIVTATYLGIKGTRAQQQFYPNTYPTGVANPCPLCLSGYKYLTSNGNSTREAGTIQVRRRLHNGFTASIQYTLSKAIDDAGLGGGRGGTSVIAQNWLNLSGERGLSSFDAHHTVAMQMQYSTGVGVAGGALLSGWKGLLLKEWTINSQINVSSGLPLTPIYPVGVAGTGLTGIRPNYTGAPLYDDPSGRFLNPAAYVAPPFGQWGNAGRDSIIGPGQFSLNASMGRSFTIGDRHSIDLRLDAANALNHVTYPNWNTNILSQQFGLPNTANGMRVVRANLRLRF
jgi:hypothetical protein